MKNIIINFLFVLTIYGCGGKKQPENLVSNSLNEDLIVLTNAQVQNGGIVVGKMEQKKISSILKLNGKIDVPPQNMVSISVPLGGYLKKTKLLPGMHLNKGDIIAVIQDQQYIQLQQDYLSAKAKIYSFENEYSRQKVLNLNKSSSDKDLQKAEADFRTQQVLITSLAKKLELAGIDIHTISEVDMVNSVNIYSPIDGYVSKVNVNIGKYVAPTDVLFELIDPRDIHLALRVFEKDLGNIFIGQKLTAYTNHEPDKRHVGEIILIGKDISSDRSTEVHCHFDKYDKVLVPGTYMNADVEVLNRTAYVLPESAIVSYKSKQYAYIKLGENQYQQIEVNTGNCENGYIEIISPEMNEKKEFVVNGAYSILMSAKNKSEE